MARGPKAPSLCVAGSHRSCRSSRQTFAGYRQWVDLPPVTSAGDDFTWIDFAGGTQRQSRDGCSKSTLLSSINMRIYFSGLHTQGNGKQLPLVFTEISSVEGRVINEYRCRRGVASVQVRGSFLPSILRIAGVLVRE